MCRIPAAGKNVVTTTFLRRVYPPSLDSSILACRQSALGAVATATTAIRFRFGWDGWLGVVTPQRVAVAASGGRLLAPGWPPPRG
jgi:hypothetical protein